MAAEAQNVPDPSKANEGELHKHRMAKLVDGLIDRKVTKNQFARYSNFTFRRNSESSWKERHKNSHLYRQDSSSGESFFSKPNVREGFWGEIFSSTFKSHVHMDGLFLCI